MNYGKGHKRLGEVDLGEIFTDSQLFQAINEKYKEIRSATAGSSYLLRPATVHFVKVCASQGFGRQTCL